MNCKKVLTILGIICLIAIVVFVLVYSHESYIKNTYINPYSLTVYESPFPKIRMGNDGDGGYIIADIPLFQYDYLLGCGVSDDISFEVDFLSRYPEVKSCLFDGTVDSLPEKHPNITFVKKNIGPKETENETNLSKYFELYNNMFLKMDIEGGEYPWFEILTENQIDKFEQIVLEFHEPNSKQHQSVFDKINKTHYLIHIHGNNNLNEPDYHQGIKAPKVFECTYLNKKYFRAKPKLNKDKLPITNLDKSNSPGTIDIDLSYPPFTNSSEDVIKENGCQ